MGVILHIITTIAGGGSEAALTRLVIADADPRRHHIVCLTSGDAPELRAAGVSVHCLDMPAGRLTLRGLKRLAALIRRLQPDVVQTWMYHADLVGGVVTRLVSRRPVFWGLRNANLETALIGARTRATVAGCAWLSHIVPTRIVSCSAAGARLHVKAGYAPNKLSVIPNGYDLATLQRDEAARRRLRTEWAVGDSTILFGMVARWDPQKDHGNLLAALAQFEALHSGDWRCLLVGSGMTLENRALAQLLGPPQLRRRVILAGPRADIAAVMSALDVHVLSSRGESFPNVVAEAMACGTPCIVTDVGDARSIVGDATGWVVPPRDSSALAAAMAGAAVAFAQKDEWRRRQARARERIVHEYGIDKMVENYRALWAEVA